MKYAPILFIISSLMASPSRSEVTYHRDIAPIIYGNCTGCHRESESAPFPLSSFEEVSKKARTIRQVVSDRYMPPWHASQQLAHTTSCTETRGG